MTLRTATEVCRLLATQAPWYGTGQVFDPDTLRGWRAKGLLADHGLDTAGRALYDFAEVHALARQRVPRGDRRHAHPRPPGEPGEPLAH